MTATTTTGPELDTQDTGATRLGGRRRGQTRTALAYTVLTGLGLLLLRGIGGKHTVFQLAEGESLIELPSLRVPSLPLVLAMVLGMAVLTALAWLLTSRGRTVPAWAHTLFGLALVTALLTWVAAGKDAVMPVTALLAGALALSVPLIFGALSGIVCERTGIINIAIEGQLLAGAFAAAVVASLARSPYVGLVAAPLAGTLVAVLLALFAIRYEVNQIIVGVVLNTLVLGLTSFLFSTVLSEDAGRWNARQRLPEIAVPGLSEIPVLGPVLFRQTILVYLMYAVVIALHVLLFRSRWGLRSRAVGEHPKAADTVGIKVNRTRWVNTLIGGAIAGLGGAFFTIGNGLAFGKDMSAGNGFIALAAMIIGRWSPAGAVMAALLFGFSRNLGNVLSTMDSPLPTDLLLMLPYLITILAVAGFVGRVRPPAAEGVPYRTEGH